MNHNVQGRPGTLSVVPGGDALPTFLIIGAPKGGTTSLARYLEQHPDVSIAAEKEVHFFDDNFDRGLDWYRSRFAGAGARAIGEASPTYLMRRDAHPRIASVIPNARLIAVLRNPIDRAYSDYWFQRSLGFENRSFADAVRAEIADPADVPFFHLGAGLYDRQIEDLGVHLPPENLLVLLFDDLTADAAGTFAAVCRFIGVDDTFRPPDLGRVFNPSMRLRSEGLRRFMLRTHMWRRLPRWIPDTIDRLNRRNAPYPPMDDAIRRELVAYFAPHNADLGRRLGRDLSAWDA